MDEMLTEIGATALRLAAVAEQMAGVLARMEAQQEVLCANVARIVAAIEEQGNVSEVKASAARERKTLAPVVSILLAKSGVEEQAMESAALDKALGTLSVEQRIAVKAELYRAGLIA